MTTKFATAMALLACVLAATPAGAASPRPEASAFPYKVAVAEAGDYAADGAWRNFVLSGSIEGDVAIAAAEGCRVHEEHQADYRRDELPQPVVPWQVL